MKRRKFIQKAGLATAGAMIAPYILPSGRLFAATGSRLVNHVVFVLFAGGIRNQESVDQQYLASQGLPTQGNVMENLLSGSRPTSNLVYDRWAPVLSTPLSQQGTLFKELRYSEGPTGHYNGHTVAMTGNYTSTGLNLNINPASPTVFEYYRKHTDPATSAINAWWLSEGLGPYPSLNYSRDSNYGPNYGANYLRAATVFDDQIGLKYLQDSARYQPDDVDRIAKLKTFLDNNFDKTAADLPGIRNTEENRELLKGFFKDIVEGTIPIEYPTPGNDPTKLTGDHINILAAWKVLEQFQPELMVINTFNLDVCHFDFSQYINFLHKADYGIGWLWNKIQNSPMANDTIMVCMPEHGRNLDPNSVADSNGLLAYDHTNDDNSRRNFALIVGPPGVVKQGQVIGNVQNPIGENIDMVPTIAHILGFKDDIPGGYLQGRVLNEAFF